MNSSTVALRVARQRGVRPQVNFGLNLIPASLAPDPLFQEGHVLGAGVLPFEGVSPQIQSQGHPVRPFPVEPHVRPHIQQGEKNTLHLSNVVEQPQQAAADFWAAVIAFFTEFFDLLGITLPPPTMAPPDEPDEPPTVPGDPPTIPGGNPGGDVFFEGVNDPFLQKILNDTAQESGGEGAQLIEEAQRLGVKITVMEPLSFVPGLEVLAEYWPPLQPGEVPSGRPVNQIFVSPFYLDYNVVIHELVHAVSPFDTPTSNSQHEEGLANVIGERLESRITGIPAPDPLTTYNNTLPLYQDLPRFNSIDQTLDRLMVEGLPPGSLFGSLLPSLVGYA